MNTRKLIELNIKLEQIWFENILISGEAYSGGRLHDCVEDQMDSIEGVRGMIKDELNRKFRINGDVDYDELFGGKYGVDEIISKLKLMGDRSNNANIRIIK